jgi:hypothetical protein
MPSTSKPSSRLVTAVSSALVVGMLFSFGCEPRKKAKTGGVGTAATPVAVAPTNTATTTATGTGTATTAATPTGTATTPAPAGTWPTGVPSVDPAVLADIMAKAGAALGLPATGGVPGVPGDPLEAALKANAAKTAPGFTPASAVGRAKLKQGEHAGMNVDLEQGKCYVVVGAGGAGVTQVGLAMLFPAAPPNAVMASDTAHGNAPVIGEGKPLCPPMKASVRVDVVPLQGAGDVGVQLYVK